MSNSFSGPRVFSVDTWAGNDLIRQNYLKWRAKELAQKYQATLSVAI